MDLREIKTLLRLESNERREERLVGLCASAVDWYNDHNQDVPDNVPEEREIKLLKLLKGYVLPPENIAFRRFIQLNMTNLLLCEHEISILNDKYAANPGLLLEEQASGKLKTLLADYSMFLLTWQNADVLVDQALSNYQKLLSFERATPREVVSHTKFESWATLFIQPQPSQRESKVFDYMIIRENPGDRLTPYLQRLPNCMVYDKHERSLLYMTRNVHGYLGHGRRIAKIGQVIFAVLGALALLVPLVILTFVKAAGYRLLITVVSVLVVEVGLLSIFSEASNQEVLAASAAYAAVLVVFLGASS